MDKGLKAIQPGATGTNTMNKTDGLVLKIEVNFDPLHPVENGVSLKEVCF